MKISFIIPAHNAEKTIERSVSSITRLNLNYEILIIENGSIDNTAIIIRDIAQNNANVKVFTSEKGVSKARNKGLMEATGDWIVFVDADDLVLKEIEQIVEQLFDQDILIASYKKDNDLIQHDYKTNNIISGEELTDVISWLIDKPTIRMQAWAKVFRKVFLIKNDLLFNEELVYSEDSEFVIRALLKAKNLQISSVPIYQYKSDSPSAMRGVNPDRIQKYIDALNCAKADIKSEGNMIKQAFQNYVIAHINIIAVHDIFGYDVKEGWRERINKIKELLKEDVIKEVIEKLSIKDGRELNKLPAVFFHYGLFSLGGFLCYVRSCQNRRRYKKAIRIS